MGVLSVIFPIGLLLSQDSATGLSLKDLEAYESRVQAARKSCGPVALCYCLRRSGKDVSPERVIGEFVIDEQGVNLKDLLEVSASFGAPAKAVSLSTKRFDLLPKPSILILNSVHCVVSDRMDADGQNVVVFDPAIGHSTTATVEAMQRSWTGEAVIFSEPPLTVSGWLSLAFITMLCVCAAFGLARWAMGHWRRRKLLPKGGSSR